MRYTFNQYSLDTERFELRKDGILVHVEPQVVELLSLLIKKRDRMVSKEEINEIVWRGRIVSEAALSSRIKMARQVLGDDGRKQAVIRTIHRKGFRFVADVEEELTSQSGEIKSSPGETSAGGEGSERKRSGISKPSVAVLPFSNLSNDADQEYFSDGIGSDIIDRLSKHRWLNVTARNTTFGYKDKTIDMRQLARELEVDYVVEGTVRRAGDRVRVTVALVDPGTGLQVWTDRYDREIDDIFALQDEVTEMIVARLEPEIGLSERNKVIGSRPANLEAWDSYHLGLSHFFKFTGPDNLLAQKMLLQSQQMDSRFGEAYAWWAYATIIGMVYWDTQPTQELLDKALEACNTALSLDRQNATFYALKARVLLARKEYGQAIVENQTAIRLNPTFAAAHCGLGDSLAYEGRYTESVDCFTRAIELSPNDPQLWAFLSYGALALIFQEDFKEALQWADRAMSIPNCQYWATAHKVVACTYLDMKDELEKAKAKLLSQSPKFSLTFAREKLFYLRKQKQVELYIAGLEKAGLPD
jgi:adenylate cyclase